MSEPEPLLDVRGLTVSLGGRTVVDGVDLRVAPSEVVALVGESGSGKSVTALAIWWPLIWTPESCAGVERFRAPVR